MARQRVRKRSRTLDEGLARLDAILERLLEVMATTEDLNRHMRAQLGRMEGTTLH